MAAGSPFGTQSLEQCTVCSSAALLISVCCALTFLAKEWYLISVRILGGYKISEDDRRWEMRLQILSGANNNKMFFFFLSVLGPVQGRILHLITGKGTIQESIRTGISEVITEDTGDRIISEAGIEASIRGANITEEDMGTTGLTGKTTAKLTALAGGGRAPAPPREGLLPRGLEVTPEILTSRHLIAPGGLPLLGPPPTTAELSLPSVNLGRTKSHLPRKPERLRPREKTKVTIRRSSRFREQLLKMPRRLRDQSRGKTCRPMAAARRRELLRLSSARGNAALR